jgi:hypothetical protein
MNIACVEVGVGSINQSIGRIHIVEDGNSPANVLNCARWHNSFSADEIECVLFSWCEAHDRQRRRFCRRNYSLE